FLCGRNGFNGGGGLFFCCFNFVLSFFSLTFSCFRFSFGCFLFCLCFLSFGFCCFFSRTFCFKRCFDFLSFSFGDRCTSVCSFCFFFSVLNFCYCFTSYLFRTVHFFLRGFCRGFNFCYRFHSCSFCSSFCL